VAAIHQGAPGLMTGLEDPRPGSSPGSSPGFALPSPAYCFASVIVWTENKKVVNFSEEKVHPGDLAGGFTDLEMTWLLYCAGAATEFTQCRSLGSAADHTAFIHSPADMRRRH